MLASGIILMVAGAALLVLEAHVASYGVLGLAGAAALIAGMVLALGAAGVPAGVVIVLAALLAAVATAGALVLAGAAARVRGRRAHTGPEALVGRVGVVRSAPPVALAAPRAQVLVDGALWQARPSSLTPEEDEPLRAGDAVVVEDIKGLTLTVRRAERWEVEP